MIKQTQTGRDGFRYDDRTSVMCLIETLPAPIAAVKPEGAGPTFRRTPCRPAVRTA